MFRRPSTKRSKTSRSGFHLNLVPILDTMVTLIAFLMFTMSFLSIVSLESPLPVSASTRPEELDSKPLQLTMTVNRQWSELWSPFERIRPVRVPHDEKGVPDVLAIHQALVRIKDRFPHETQLVFMPDGGLPYDSIVAVMDAARTIEPSDPPLYVKNKDTGISELEKRLFPNIVFGNLLGEGS